MKDDSGRKPRLHPSEDREAEERTSVRATVIHEAIRRDGELELRRSSAALAWSGLAAGLTMGFSLLAEGVLQEHIPDTKWRPLVTALGYPLGFLIAIVGKQQLFTENTLTPIIPAMQNRNLRTLIRVARLWAIVLAANVAGAHLMAWFLACTSVLPPPLQQAVYETSRAATQVDPWTAFVRGIPAGWLIAMVVWLRAATESGDLAIIVILTYFVAACNFTHVVAGSVEYLYLVMAGHANWFNFLRDYLTPVLIGNAIGGVSITAALNHAQVISERS